MIDSSDILIKLQELKKKSGLSCHQISERAGGDLPENTIKRILNGTTVNPSLAIVILLIKTMGGSVRDFFDEDTRINLDPNDPVVINEARPACIEDISRGMSTILSPVKYAIFKTMVDLDDMQCIDILREITRIANQNKQ